MKIKVTKQVEEQIEIDVPAYYERDNSFYKITDKYIVQVMESGSILTDEISDPYGKSKVINVMKEKQISEYQFNEKWVEVIEKIHDLAGINSLENVLQ